ncbi:MAG: FAD-dependent oxidoreductase [Kiritimatiellae bacterium]|nr:FAD-dependent oxidoreductase [Kiritimatiellia bacterium]
MSRIIIIGSGISGCTAALELAELGHSITVLDTASEVGGKVMSYCCKATDECSRCGVCVAQTCITDAIAHKRINFFTNTSITSVKDTGKIIRISTKRRNNMTTISGDAVIIATGHQTYDAAQKPGFGYDRFDGVITGEEAEHILSYQTYLKKPAEDVAFIQCVGSRDPQIGRNYCSAVCCSYATRIARTLKHRNPDGNVTVYYIDLQNFDKNFSHFRRKTTDEGVHLVRAIPFSIDRTAKGKLGLKIEEAGGGKGTAKHDVVVLSVGMGPAEDSSKIAELFGLKQNSFGFLNSELPNIMVTGTCAEPQSIPDCMASARSAAAKLTSILPKLRIPQKPALPPSEIKPIRLLQKVLVIGAGYAGARTAKRLHSFGYKVTVVERSNTIGGQLAPAMRESLNFAELLSKATILTGTSISNLSGNVGKFTATLESEDGTEKNNYGAVVICSGIMLPKTATAMIDSDRVLALADLKTTIDRCAKKDRPRSVAFILDINIEESKASTEMALSQAIELRRLYRTETYVFCREIRVASIDLEALYDDARNNGVNIVKYDGKLNRETLEDQVVITAHDTLLNEDVVISCDIAGMSLPGLGPIADPKLVAITGIDTDHTGQMQKNNIHMFPEMTNRNGIFVVGACRGQYYLADIARDADSAALNVHSLLAQKQLVVNLPIPTVNADKCVLCLTCVRTCPHGAMVVDKKKNAASPVPAACQQCGVCVAECPARAIELQEITVK